jgi:hypothetical protein
MIYLQYSVDEMLDKPKDNEYNPNPEYQVRVIESPPNEEKEHSSENCKAGTCD